MMANWQNLMFIQRVQLLMRAIFLLFSLFFELFGESSVWKISDGEKSLYLGGTIHLLRPWDYPLPAEFEEVYRRSGYIVLETDVVSAQAQETLMRTLQTKTFLPENERLSQVLSPQTYRKLRRYLETQGYNPIVFERMEPWAVMLMLTQSRLTSLGVNAEGVDRHFATRALKDGRPIRYLESIDEQMGLMIEMDSVEKEEMVLQGLDDLDDMGPLLDWLVAQWRSGETAKMEKELVDEMRQRAPVMYRRVLSDRNEKWIPKLLEMMRVDKESGFVLVGAMHLIGKDGLLERFKQRGYRVERVHLESR
jgi:uncharacterized protein